MKKILAISSGGGHWVQLLRLRPAFEGHKVVFATVQQSYAEEVEGHRFYAVTDATRWSRWKMIKMIGQVCLIILRERPDVVISTGAAPGAVALRIGKWLGAKTVWIDSIANVEKISMSGSKVGKFSDLWLTQWEHLTNDHGPSFRGGGHLIFVTVGSQMPFRRLIIAMDEWAIKRNVDIDVFAQIGDTDYRPKNMSFTRSMSPKEFTEKVREATVIVAHAGMGSILSAMQAGKPLVLLPRRGDLQETRNDHQIATVKWLSGRKGIFIAMNENDLPIALEKAMSNFVKEDGISTFASPALINTLKRFIDT